MTVDGLFQWMKGHRVPPSGCARCGREQVRYFRDHAERAIGFCCLFEAIGQLTPDEQAAVDRRLASLHQRPAEGCQSCQEAGA